MKLDTLAGRLLVRGDELAIDQGRLKIKAASGKDVKHKWLQDNRDQIVAEIVERIGVEAWVYQSYSAGRYGEHRAGGVTLQFKCLSTEANPYVIFNASTTRCRNSKYHKAGSPLSEGQFRPPLKGSFCKFWKATGLSMPPRLSSFHDYMGKLKAVVFTGKFTKGEKVDAGTLQPLSLTYQQLRSAFGIKNLPYKRHTSPGQLSYSSHTRVPDKETEESQNKQSFQAILAAGESCYGKKVIRESGHKDHSSFPLKPMSPEGQSHCEWLADYDSGGKF